MPHVRVGDVRLYYRILDYMEPWRAGRPPVVLLHGLGGDHRGWLYQIADLMGVVPLLAVDLRGHGRSSDPGVDHTADDLALDVVRLLRHLGIEKVCLVGLSLGGMVAQRFAARYPYATDSLVLVDTTAPQGAAAQAAADDALAVIEAGPMRAVAAQRVTAAFSETVDPVMRDYWIDRVAQNEHAAYVRAARAVHAFVTGPPVGEIAARTLVVVGAEDRVTPPGHSEELADMIAGARLERLPGAGHLSPLEQPDAFNRLLRDFLAR